MHRCIWSHKVRAVQRGCLGQPPRTWSRPFGKVSSSATLARLLSHSQTQSYCRCLTWQLHEGLKGTVESRGQQKNKTCGFPERPEGLVDWSKRKVINTQSPGYAKLRATGAPLVDKTSAIADLLCGEPSPSFRAFFARPRKFGKVRFCLPACLPACRRFSLPADSVRPVCTHVASP
jgi:hypothetical protein